jgi:hypothetical protein
MGIHKFPETAEDNLKAVLQETRCSLRSLAKSVGEYENPGSPDGNSYEPQDGALLETTSGIKWIYSQKTGAWEIVKDKGIEDISLTPSTPPSSKAGSGGEGPSGGR